MAADIDEVLAMLDRAIGGEAIDIEEVQSLRWSVKPEHDPFVQRVYRQLQIFASDDDIRQRDGDYGKVWIDALSTLREKLLARVR